MTAEIKISNGINGTKVSNKNSINGHKVSNLEKEHNHEEREKWGSKLEFLLSCIGLSVGIGNVWRFPYLAYQNGGGAFLLAYAVMLILVGKPLFFFELAIGQFSGSNALTVWRCFPIAKGVGYAMIVMSIVVAIYYNVIMSYTLYYVGQSFRSAVPWNKCNKWWGANSNCYVRMGNQTPCHEVVKVLVEQYTALNNGSYDTNNDDNVLQLVNVTWSDRNALVPDDVYRTAFNTCHNGTQTASEQFWERYVLELTDGLANIGSLKWDLTLTLFACWIIVFLGLMKGIKSSGKIVYGTATFPYVILVTLVIYGCTLPGATEGLKYFFIPDWGKLLKIEVWRAAAEQLLFSLSIGWGCLLMYSSYNDFDNKLYRDAMFVSILDFATSIMAGVVIFAVLGNMASEMKLDIAKVAKGGQGLAFVTYPEALARLPVAQLWSVLFFFMLFLLAIDSEFAYLENVFSVIFDVYPHLKPRKTIITFFFCMLFFALGLPCVTQGGQYVLNLMDRYGGGYAGLFVATAEIIVVMWGYDIYRSFPMVPSKMIDRGFTAFQTHCACADFSFLKDDNPSKKAEYPQTDSLLPALIWNGTQDKVIKVGTVPMKTGWVQPWCAGADRFTDDIEFMLGFRLSMYWRICWKYVSPIVLIFVVVYGMIVHKPIDYGGVPYPSWGDTIGWCLMLISVLQIPLWACIQLFRYRKNWRQALRPHPDWGPTDPEIRRIYQLKYPRTYESEENEKHGVVNLAMDPVTDAIR